MEWIFVLYLYQQNQKVKPFFMEEYQIKANEEFCDRIIQTMKENGVWGWPDEQVCFVIRNGKIWGDEEALEKISRIVSKEYFNKKFGIL